MDRRKIFGAFTIAIALFFVWPTVVGTWQEVSALRQAVVERTDLLSQRTKIFENLATLHAEYQAKIRTEDGKKFISLVPVRKDTAELVSALQDIAQSSGITLSEMRLDEAKTKAGAQYKTLAMTFELAGSYTALRSFLTNLEAYVRLLNVDSITVSGDEQDSSLRFSVRADAYFIK